MGELVAWGLGIAFGWIVRGSLTSRGRIVAFAAAILALGCVITVVSGEIWSEPWLVAVDVAQVAVAALIGAFLLPHLARWIRGLARPV